MKRIDELFTVHRALSDLYKRYRPGTVAYVGNGLKDNAVVGYVAPRTKDKVFQFRGVTVSAFGEATIQAPPFIACGRAGNGLVVLEPRETMPVRQLAYVASYINAAVSWRFTWSWQTTADRVKRLQIPDDLPNAVRFDVRAYLPESRQRKRPQWRLRLKPFVLSDLYDLVPGEYHSLNRLHKGIVPVVSCGNAENGVSGYYDVNPPHRGRLTIAFNGMNTLTAKFHPYAFAAKDDVAVCSPKRPLLLATEFFIAAMLNRERWRYSFYRKCFMEKLRLFVILLPEKDGEIDQDIIKSVVESSPYWRFLKGQMTVKSITA
jgi:hypothetical protein